MPEREAQAATVPLAPDADTESPLEAVARDLEALLFAAGVPISLARLEEAVEAGSRDPSLVPAALELLAARYPVDGGHGFEVVRLADGWALRTNRKARAVLDAFFAAPPEPRLSAAALEVLAIIAYLQPVSRPQIAELRGVNSDSPVQTLLDRELIAEMGRSDGPGAAVLYGTTDRFQTQFGLGALTDLPPLEGFEPDENERAELRLRFGLALPAD